MSPRSRSYSSKHSKRTTRQVRESTIGTHVERDGRASGRSARASAASDVRTARRASRSRVDTIAPSPAGGEGRAERRQRVSRRRFTEQVQHRARSRRIAAGAVAVIVVVGIALVAGFLAFRGSVGSEIALRDSDAASALVSVRSDEPYYLLLAAELGAVAEPLQHAGPDVILLARVDRTDRTLALVNIPPGLQVATESGSKRIADLALQGDAALIGAVANFAKVDISHFVKVVDGGVAGIVDALGGIEVDIDQVIDDPHAGDVYLPVGTYTLNGNSALAYLRADNLKLGVSDQMANQVMFAALLIEKLFSADGSFAARMDAIGPYFQTDLSLGDIESLQGWLKDVPASAITCVALPGYLTEVTGVVDTGDALFVGSSDDMASIIAALEAGMAPEANLSDEVQAADSASFTVEVQNGTDIAGAGAVTGDSLAAAGFNVAGVGNAEQPVYDETLVVYKGAEGPARAKAVIDALGIGRAVNGEVYYSFASDILVIIGYDYKPIA